MEPYDVQVDQQLMEDLDNFLQEINVVPVDVPDVSFIKILSIFKKGGNIVHSLFTYSDIEVQLTSHYFFQKISYLSNLHECKCFISCTVYFR